MYHGTTISDLTATVDRHIPQERFRCDACQQEAPTSHAVTSTVLPCSRFCCTDCREDAEVAAQNARA
jgi:hypothetical protein